MVYIYGRGHGQSTYIPDAKNKCDNNSNYYGNANIIVIKNVLEK